MPCKKCGSDQRSEFASEINLHFPDLIDRDEQAVLLFPKLLVCLECGFTEFFLSQNELPLVSKRIEH
jgi:hypothetical protein